MNAGTGFRYTHFTFAFLAACRKSRCGDSAGRSTTRAGARTRGQRSRRQCRAWSSRHRSADSAESRHAQPPREYPRFPDPYTARAQRGPCGPPSQRAT